MSKDPEATTAAEASAEYSMLVAYLVTKGASFAAQV